MQSSTKIKDIFQYTETFAPICTAMDFDNCGLLVGEMDTKISTVLVALDITKEVVDEAINHNAQLIISHHPVIFNPIKKLSPTDMPYVLAKNNIAALCLHTNLDLATDGGVNFCLAQALSLNNVEFVQNQCLAVGDLNEEMPTKLFANQVKNALGCNGLRFTSGNGTVRRVAVSGGAGGENVFACKSLNADCLVTGEIKHHEILAANSLGIAVVDASHYKTEDIVIGPLVAKLSQKFSNVTFIKSHCFTDKMEYIC